MREIAVGEKVRAAPHRLNELKSLCFTKLKYFCSALWKTIMVKELNSLLGQLIIAHVIKYNKH